MLLNIELTPGNTLVIRPFGCSEASVEIEYPLGGAARVLVVKNEFDPGTVIPLGTGLEIKALLNGAGEAGE